MKELPGNALALDRVHAVLDRMSQERETGGKEKATATKSSKGMEDDDDPDDPEEIDRKALRQSDQMHGSMGMTAKL